MVYLYELKVSVKKMNTTREDLLIILGDAGINFSDGWRDENKKTNSD